MCLSPDQMNENELQNEINFHERVAEAEARRGVDISHRLERIEQLKLLKKELENGERTPEPVTPRRGYSR